jgi:MYXO-CTERM domain-containing protein
VGEPAPGSPAPPVVAAVDFSVSGILSDFGGDFDARFTFEPFEGILVADPEGTLSSAFEGLEISFREPGEKPVYYLVKEPCYVNFDTATWGAPATLRFGSMDLAGNFSGWSEPTFIEYPVDVTEYPEVVLARNRPYAFANNSNVCSVGGATPSKGGFGLLAVFVVAGAVRRARGRSHAGTS